MDELYAVGWRAAGRPAAVGLVGVPVAGTGGWRGARLCGVRGRRPVYGTEVARVDDGTVEAVPGTPAGGGARDAPTGLMAEQKLVVPACPRRENGHLWRFDRERSTGDCQADVCQACGLVRLTSYRTGQVVRYAGSGACDGA